MQVQFWMQFRQRYPAYSYTHCMIVLQSCGANGECECAEAKTNAPWKCVCIRMHPTAAAACASFTLFPSSCRQARQEFRISLSTRINIRFLLRFWLFLQKPHSRAKILFHIFFCESWTFVSYICSLHALCVFVCVCLVMDINSFVAMVCSLGLNGLFREMRVRGGANDWMARCTPHTPE